MRVILTDKHNKSFHLNTGGKRVAIHAPDAGEPLMIQAIFQEGSPISIIVDGQTPRPISGLRIINSRITRVPAFAYIRNKKKVHVREHDRHYAVRYKPSGKTV